ncbi:unnamed protein product [Closterium sp. NIES-53]
MDDLVFATADTEALAHMKSELQKRHTCTDLGELTSYLGLRITRDRAQRTITLTLSHMVQQVLQRFGFIYSSPQSTPLPTGHLLSAPPSDESVEPSGPYPELVGCLISSCEAEIYAGAMAAQELRWLTYLLTNLGEAPRSPSQHGQHRLAYVASQANTAYVFTKALQPCDHQLEEVEEVEVVVGVVSGVGGGSGGRGGGGGGGGGGGSGGGGSGGGGAGCGAATQRGGLGGSQRQQQLHTRETPSVQQLREQYAGRGRSGGAGPCTYVLRTGTRSGEVCGLPHNTQRFFGRLTDAWRAQFPYAVELPRWHDLLLQNVPIFDLDIDAILAAMYALADITEGDCYLSVPPDPGTVAAALGASAAAALGASASAAPGAGASPLSGTAPTASFHTFTLDSGASRSFFRDITTLTPLSRPVAVSLADPSRGPVLAHSSTVLPCPAALSGLLSGLHLPSFSMNLVSGADLQDTWVDQFTPGGTDVSEALGWFLSGFFIFNSYMTVCALMTNHAVLLVFGLLEVTLMLLFIGNFNHQHAVQGWIKAGGFFGLFTAIAGE